VRGPPLLSVLTPVGLSAMTGTPQGLKAIKKQRKNLKLKLLRNQKELSSNRIQFFLVSLVLILKIFFPCLRFALIAFDLNRLIFIDLSVSPLS